MRYFIAILFCLVGFWGLAQSNQLRYGYLKDSVTKEAIILASVTNTHTQQTVMTAHQGRFAIQMKEGEVLAFAAVGYFFDTLQVNKSWLSNDSLIFYLKPLSKDLGNVTVFTKGMNHYQMDSMQRRKAFLQSISNYTIPSIAKANSGAGIAFNIDRLSKREKQKRTAMQFFERFEKEAYINYRFHAALVSKYSQLQNEALYTFIQKYRPNYAWLRNHPTEEDLLYYINEKLKLK